MSFLRPSTLRECVLGHGAVDMTRLGLGTTWQARKVHDMNSTGQCRGVGARSVLGQQPGQRERGQALFDRRGLLLSPEYGVQIRSRGRFVGGYWLGAW